MTGAPTVQPTMQRLAMRGLALVEARYVWIIAALVAIAIALVVIAMRGGIGVTPDSVGYASGARNFAATGQFTYFDGKPLVLWPVGLPLVLGIGHMLGLEVTTAAIVLDVLACGALIALAAAMSLRATGSKPFSVAIAAAVVVAHSTVHIYSRLWSEPLFIVACLAAVVLLMDVAARGPSLLRLVAAIACVWAASNLRFMGVTLVPVVGVALLAAGPGRPSPRAVAAAAALTVVAGFGTLIVFARNYLVGGTATGTWYPSRASIGALTQTTLETIGHWLLPIALPGLLAGIGLSILAVYGAVVLLRDAATRRVALPMAAYVAAYVGGLLLVESRVDGFIDERYLAPVLVPSLILVGVALRHAWRLATTGWRGSASAHTPVMRGAGLVAAAVIVVGVVTYVGVNAYGSARFAALKQPTRGGYNGLAARTSKLALAAGAVAGDPGVISNDPEHVYWVTSRFPTYAPRSFTRYGNDAEAALKAWISSGSVTTFAEFTQPHTSGGWKAADLRKWGITLSDPVTYPDGTLYRLSIPTGAAGRGMPAGG